LAAKFVWRLRGVWSSDDPRAKAVSILLSDPQDGSHDVERSWDLLVANLEAGDCVPFLGAGACGEHILPGSLMARKWGDIAQYPLYDRSNLPRVMQYIATTEYDGDSISLKRDFVNREIADVDPPNFGQPNQVHGLLARFDLPLYVTTNYDDFMFLALQHQRRNPRQAYSPWYVTDSARLPDSPLADPAYDPTPGEPLVFHLHGHYRDPQSLVLTEDDYIEYLVQLAGDTHRRAGVPSGLLPAYVHGRLRGKPLLFIGYSLRDWTFLVLFRTLLHGIPDTHRRRHISVQVDPRERSPRRARTYLERYLSSQHIQIFWDSASDFAEKLNARRERTPA
jgi:hypothetical protein